MQGAHVSGGSAALALLRREEDERRLRLDAIRARMQHCVALARELPELERRVTERPLLAQGVYRTEARDLVERVDEARRAREERLVLRLEEANVMKDLELLRMKLEGRGIKHVALPMLEDVSIASPCNVSWADMAGDSDTRFCALCEKHVYNLSMMSRVEAEAAVSVARQTGGACFRLYRRDDGTVITNDCPVGQRFRFWRRTRGIAMAGLLLAAFGAFAYSQMTATVHCAGQSATMGFQ